MRTCHLVFFFTLMGLVQNNYCKSQNNHFTAVIPPQGGWGTIHAIVQDARGFLWFANDIGLFKYDGLEYISYRNEPANPNSLARDWVESLYADENDFLLIGTHGSGLDRFDIATGKFTHYRYNAKDTATLSNDIVTAITKDKQGNYWIGTHDGLDKFDLNTGKFKRYRNIPGDSTSLSDNQVRVLFADDAGALWVGTKSPWLHDGGTRVGGLNKLNIATGKFTRYMHNAADTLSVIDNCVTAIFEDAHKNFWIGTAGNGLDIMNKEKGTFEHYIYNPENSGTLKKTSVNNITQPDYDYITFIKEDAKKKVWIGTLLSGMNVYDPLTKEIDYYGTGKASKDSLPDNKFSAAFSTKDNLFWVASWSSNLYKLNPYKPPLPYNYLDKAVADFSEDRNGDVWMATSQGLFKRTVDGTLQQFLVSKRAADEDNVMSSLREDDQHNLWLGNMFTGLYRFNPSTKTFTHFQREDGNTNSLICDTVLSLAKTKDNKLWIGTANGLDLLDLSTGIFQHYRHNDKDTNTIGGTNFSDVGSGVYCVAVTGNNDVWVTVANAVNKFDKSTSHFRRYIFNIYPNYIFEDHKKNIWVATDAGLFKYDNGKDLFLRYYDSTCILKTNTGIYNIAEDEQANLWLRTGKGFIKLNTKKSEASIYEDDQQTGSPILKRYITQRGEFLSGAATGYISFSPNRFLKDPLPEIVITGFSLSQQPLTATAGGLLSRPVYQLNEIHLKHNQNIFSIQFTAIDFTGNGEKKYILYMLDGYDENWRKAESEETARYYSIPPGTYTFKVKVLGSDGAWAQKNLLFVISPPWWTTWWAYCIYAVCLLVVGFFANRIIRNRIIEKERIKSREKELAQAREIEKAYKKLKSTQAQLVQAEKMASLGELTAGIAHEIQNPLNFVNNFSELNTELIDELKSSLEKGDKEDVLQIAENLKSNEEKIIHHGKRADAIVKGMLQHSRKDTGQKEPTDINALCDEYLRLSYHGLRAKDKNFNADFKTEFDQTIGKINIVPQDVGRALLNLLNNAFYATSLPANFQNSEQYKPFVFIRTRKIKSASGIAGAEITVTDNGNGIPKNIIDKIFQPFFTTKPTGEGTGLGLSLSYDIITKEHNGSIEAKSKEGEGSTFVIWLPYYS